MTFRCSPYHTNSALYPVIIHLEQLLQLRHDETPEAKFAKLEQVLGTYRFPQDDTMPLLATLLGIALPAHVPPSRLTPEQQRQHTQTALVAWTLEEAERRPVLVVWEDLQWLDPSSLEMLSLHIEQTPTVPMLTVVTSRPEFQLPWGTRSHLTPMTLGNLGSTQVEAIATTVAGGKALPPAILAQIAEKTDGVPLFVEEITKAILESGVLREVDGRYELTGPLETVTIPITLHDALMARLDRLATAKSLAQLGAVIGRQFSYDLVKALTDYDEARLQREIAQLVDAELLYQRGLPPRITYLFKHALIRDVAYESLLRQRRQALHGAIAQAIETLEGERVEEQAGILAYHYARSLHQDKAVTYALLAGDAAMRLHARAEATTSYEQALTIARALQESPQAQRAQIDATLKLAAVGTTRQDITRDQENLEQAQRLAETLADEPRMAQVLYWLGRLSYIRGDLQTAVMYARQSLQIADRLRDDTLAAPPVNLLGRVYFMQSDYLNASQLLARSAEQMRRLGNTAEEATAAGIAGVSLGLLGEFDQALAYAEHGLRLAKDMQNPFAESAAYQYRANVHDPRGAWEQAMADCAEARRIAERVGDLFRVYIVKFFEGRAHTQAGDPVRGRGLLEESLTLAGQLGTTFCLAWANAYLAECLLRLDEPAVVTSLCHATIDLAEETGHTLSQTLAYRVLAEALGAQSPADPQQSEHAMLEAIRMQQEIGVKPELARSYVRYARLLQGWGQEDQANAHLTKAISMFQEMGMHWDVAQTEEVRRTLS
jgi:tetratricopeptide (TPR) repeat protein